MVRFTPWLLKLPGKNVTHPLRSMLAGCHSQYVRFWWSRIYLIPVGNVTLHPSSHIIVTAPTTLSQVPCHWKHYLHMMQGNRFNLGTYHFQSRKIIWKGTGMDDKTRKKNDFIFSECIPYPCWRMCALQVAIWRRGSPDMKATIP